MQTIVMCMMAIFLLSPVMASAVQPPDNHRDRTADNRNTEDTEKPEAIVEESFIQSEELSDPYSSIPDHGLDWGSDVMVYSIPQSTRGYVRYIDYDYDPSNGDLYVSIILEYYIGGSSYCHLYIYRSENGGYSWSRFYAAGGGAGRSIRDCMIRIVADASGDSWVVVSSCWESLTADYFYDLWTARCRASGGYMTWENVADSIRTDFRPDLDAVVSTGSGNAPHPYVYMSYSLNTEWAVMVSRNKLDGSGWTDCDRLTTDIACYKANIEDAGGGDVAVVFPICGAGTLYDMVIARSTDYGETWLPATEILSGIPLNHLFDFAMTSNSTSGWLVVEAKGESPGTTVLQTYYTSDNGYSWNDGDIVAELSDDFWFGLSLRCSKLGSAVTLAFKKDRYAMFSWSYSYNPSAFTNPIQVSDDNIAGCFVNDYIVAGWNISGSTVLFMSTDFRSVLLDWWHNYSLDGGTELPIAIDDTETASSALTITGSSPNPAISFTSITFSLTESASVDISVFDTAGRQVAVLSENEPFGAGDNSVEWDCIDDGGSPVPSGLYYCRLMTFGTSETHSLVVMR